jgi:hypothetical protein
LGPQNFRKGLRGPDVTLQNETEGAGLVGRERTAATRFPRGELESGLVQDKHRRLYR